MVFDVAVAIDAVVGLVERTAGDVDIGDIMNAEPNKGKAAMDAMRKNLVVDDTITAFVNRCR